MADTAFTGLLLGTYEFKAGQTDYRYCPLFQLGEDLPCSQEMCRAVECVIQDAGDFTKNEYISNDAARLTINWSVFLVAWEPAKGSDMQAAAERACSRFLGSEAVQTVAVSDGLGALVQTKVMIRSDMPILAA